MLLESTGPAIDKVMFAANAAGAGPAGLLYNVAPLTPTAAGGDKAQALVDDLQKIATAIGSVAGNSAVVLVAAPAQSIALRLRLLGAVEWPVLTSASLTAALEQARCDIPEAIGEAVGELLDAQFQRLKGENEARVREYRALVEEHIKQIDERAGKLAGEAPITPLRRVN